MSKSKKHDDSWKSSSSSSWDRDHDWVNDSYYKSNDLEPVDVLITSDARLKQDSLVELCEKEIGWFGVVDTLELEGGGTIDRVYDIIVPKQKVSYGSVNHNGFDLNDFLEEHQDVAHQIKYYGHSHVNFSVIPSVIDTDQIRDWGEYGMSYIISHIQNKEGQTYTRVDQFKPNRMTSKVRLIEQVTNDIYDWAQEVLDTKVEIEKWSWKKKDDKDKNRSVVDDVADSVAGWWDH